MREIPLTQGMVAQVDDEDYEEVSQYRWIYHRPRHSKTGYAQAAGRSEQGGYYTLRMHHLVFGMPPDGLTVDHRDGDGLNNRRSNLRVASRVEQCWNRRPRAGSKTGLKGVFPTTPGRWVARIRSQGKRWNLGTFRSPEEAARAYDAKARELYGDFAYLNIGHELAPRTP